MNNEIEKIKYWLEGLDELSFNKVLDYITQLTNNWNELEEWLKEYINKNDNWYNNELSNHDKQYYGDTYYNTNYMLEKFLDKMKEIKERK